MTKLYDNVDHLGTNASAAYTVETDVLVVGAGNAGMEAPPRPLKKLALTPS